MGMLRSLFRREEKVAIPKVIGPADPVLTAAIVALVGIPIGCLGGLALAHLIATAMATELYRIPVRVDPSTMGFAAMIVLFSSTLAALFVVRRVRSLDLIAVLKTRE